MASPPVLDDPNQASRRAKTRIAVATVLLAVAIGGLTLLSRQQPGEKAAEPVAQKQQSISSGESAQPGETAPPAPTQISSKDQEPPPPQPSPEPTPAPATETPPAPTAPPPPPPPTLAPVKPQPPAPSAAPAKKPAAAAPVREEPAVIKAAPPAKPIEKPAPAPRPVEQAAPAPKATPAQPAPAAAKPVTTPKSFDVQVGVFTDMENAKQLQTKLAEHGIPSHTETKLQVGPFNTKAEAEAAREKLKSLGIGSVVVPGK